MVIAMGEKTIEANPSTNTIGRKTATKVRVDAITALLPQKLP